MYQPLGVHQENVKAITETLALTLLNRCTSPTEALLHEEKKYNFLKVLLVGFPVAKCISNQYLP